MNADEREVCDLFEYSLTQLRVDDEGVAASDFADVLACANLCRAVRRVAADTDDVEALLLHQLVDATELVLTTYAVVASDNPAIVTRWVKARGELLSCRLGAVE